MNYTITILAFLLILVTFARYLVHLKRELKEAEALETELEIYKDFDKSSRLANDILRQRNCELVDKLNAIESKMQDVTVGEGDRIVPLLPGSYRIEAACNSVIIGCEAGCKSLSGGELKHHKDCKYYPDSLSKYYDDLKFQFEKYIEEKEENKPVYDTEFGPANGIEMDLIETLGYREEDIKVLEQRNQELINQLQYSMNWIVERQKKEGKIIIDIPDYFNQITYPIGQYRTHGLYNYDKIIFEKFGRDDSAPQWGEKEAKHYLTTKLTDAIKESNKQAETTFWNMLSNPA